MNGAGAGSAVMDPVMTVRDPEALREARRRKSENAFKAAGFTKEDTEAAEWDELEDSWVRSFWVEPAIAAGPDGEEEPEEEPEEPEEDDEWEEDDEEQEWEDEEDADPVESVRSYGDKRTFEVEFKHNSSVVVGTNVYDPDAF
jgi:hypothetical protein